MKAISKLVLVAVSAVFLAGCGTTLYHAAKNGDSARVKELVEKGVDINAIDKNGKTPLHRAAYWGYEQAVVLLLENGADVNAKDKDGRTPLLEARAGLSNVRRWSEDDDAYWVKYAKKFGQGHEKITVLLIENGAANGLHWAAGLGLESVAERLIQNGADVNEKIEPGSTPLPWSARHEQIADVNEKIKSGGTPLHWAARHEQIAALLIDNGADVNAKDKSGNTLLHYAAYSGYEEVAALLIDNGADVNAENQDGETPLLEAFDGHFQLAALLDREDDYAKDFGRGHEKIAALLLKNGANPDAKNEDGDTLLLRTAGRADYQQIAASLIENGADVNAKDEYGWTPLQKAVGGGHEKLVALLLENGANPYQPNAKGESALQRAVNKGDEDVIGAFVSAGVDTELLAGLQADKAQREWEREQERKREQAENEAYKAEIARRKAEERARNRQFWLGLAGQITDAATSVYQQQADQLDARNREAEIRRQAAEEQRKTAAERQEALAKRQAALAEQESYSSVAKIYVGGKDGWAWGAALGMKSKALADQHALRLCQEHGYGACGVVQRWRGHGCVAFAIDQDDPFNHALWVLADDLADAKRSALAQCGSSCEIDQRMTGCTNE